MPVMNPLTWGGEVTWLWALSASGSPFCQKLSGPLCASEDKPPDTLNPSRQLGDSPPHILGVTIQMEDRLLHVSGRQLTLICGSLHNIWDPPHIWTLPYSGRQHI